MGIKKPPGKFQLMEFNLIFILSVKGEVESVVKVRGYKWVFVSSGNVLV